MRFLRKHKLLRLTLLAFGAIVVYGAIVPVRRIQLTRQVVPLARLAPKLRGFRLVQLSDLHCSLVVPPSRLARAVALANACDPDLVVITGDFVSYRSLAYLPAGLRELQALRSRHGVIACLGNHEHWEGVEKVRPLLEAAGIRVLVNESVPVTGNLWVGAVDDLMSGQPDLARTVTALPPDAAVVLLSHNPTILPQVANHPWLVLAGHTHGGQLALPFLGPRGTIGLPGINTLARTYEQLNILSRGGRLEAAATYRYPAGWYAAGSARMYVNRGLGVSQAQPLRLNCPPEVSLLILQPAERGRQARSVRAASYPGDRSG
jgi:uncharacterized protein